MSDMPEPTDAPTAPPVKPKAKRGFAAMDPAKQRELAQAGARKLHESGNAHKFTPDEARVAGAKGGQKIGQNREHMRAIGKKGGAKVAKDRAHMAEIGKKGAAATHDASES